MQYFKSLVKQNGLNTPAKRPLTISQRYDNQAQKKFYYHLGPVLTRSYDFSMLVYSAQGGASEVDIGAKSFRKLVVAVVDANGCALVRQEINGSFEKVPRWRNRA